MPPGGPRSYAAMLGGQQMQQPRPPPPNWRPPPGFMPGAVLCSAMLIAGDRMLPRERSQPNILPAASLGQGTIQCHVIGDVPCHQWSARSRLPCSRLSSTPFQHAVIRLCRDCRHAHAAWHGAAHTGPAPAARLARAATAAAGNAAHGSAAARVCYFCHSQEAMSGVCTCVPVTARRLPRATVLTGEQVAAPAAATWCTAPRNAARQRHAAWPPTPHAAPSAPGQPSKPPCGRLVSH